MLVGFLHVGDDIRLPAKMIANVRRYMPKADVVHMTDEKTPSLGCERRELPYDGKLMTYRLDHLAALPDGELLVLDTDVMVQTDLGEVFAAPFDVALTKREGRIMYGGKDIVASMPYNTGVMFTRKQAFWRECAELCHQMPEDLQRWWGDQLAVKSVADARRYKVIELPCERFNYTPRTQDEDVSDKFAVHYKGQRKDWMLNAA